MWLSILKMRLSLRILFTELTLISLSLHNSYFYRGYEWT